MKSMKSTFLFLAMFLCATLSVNAQTTDIDHTFEFVDANGDIVANGSIINRTEVEENAFGDKQISSGLYAKNTTDELKGVAVQLTIASLPSGSFQHCFPGACQVTSSPKTGYSYIQGPLTSTAGATESLQSEWLIDEGNYGTCTVTYQFKFYNVNVSTFEYEYLADGPSVTVNYMYIDPAGIDTNVADKKLNSITYYDLSGRRISEPVSGVYVKRMSYADGTVKTDKVSLK